MVNGIWLLVLGLLAAPNLLLSRKPEAKPFLDKFAPYQGWMGAVSAFWGAWQLIQSILHIDMFAAAPIAFITWVAMAASLLGLGLLLGVGVLKSIVKNPSVTERLDSVLQRLAPHQGRLGMVAVALGIWAMVASVIYRV